ncbi:Only proline and serine are matching in the corresponding protein [Pleurostoma richardsiae]|uniref:Only proline and serine are matching in the corresponding protein n=1 Tax=Pleurostoma richardsiae TaxID=41990 RepID=A0AA38S4V0_9PEZI|nr:Only proline and serine are matching in the corresponding protein [Pleurostoma richardsiae]
MTADNTRLRELTLVKKLEEETYLKKLLADQVQQAEIEHQKQHQEQQPSPSLHQWAGFDGDDTSSPDIVSSAASATATTTTSTNATVPFPSSSSNFLYINTDSSSSDLASPLTPTFSQRGGNGHLRGSSSHSSLELMPSTSASFSFFPDCPASPTTQVPQQPQSQAAQGNTVGSTVPAKSPLPDVQEDPLERDDEVAALSDRLDLYTCLCDEPCLHNEPNLVQSEVWPPTNYSLDYDVDFLSDSDFDATPGNTVKRRRAGTLNSASGRSSRFGSRITSLTRWRSVKRPSHTFTPASEPSLERARAQSLSHSISHAASSRSSSVSGPSRYVFDRANEPPLPPTPAMSFYGSTDSIASLGPVDIEKPEVRKSLERDRALATTPLLPPLMTASVISAQSRSSRPPSPLQSPSVAPSPSAEAFTPTAYATPPLSTKPSLSSFRPPLVSSFSAPTVATSDCMVPPIPNLLEQHDEWSDRLGHANYTILPKPYTPEIADLAAVELFRADWDQARVNYTKHLVRTGEHYGTTSKTYALTEAKWAETEREWKAAHDAAIGRLAASGGEGAAAAELLQRKRLQEDVAPPAVPRILDAEGKFPDLGDEDIVGPMMRDAVMVRAAGPEEKQNGASKFFKNLAGKVGLRK